MTSIFRSALCATLFLTTLAGAQTQFAAQLWEGEEVPPTGSTKCGWAEITLNPDSSVTYLVRTNTVGATGAHIHTAPAGANGPITVGLSGGPNVFSGTSAPLSGADVAALRSEGMYVNVHTPAFGPGEIRGQIKIFPNTWAAHITQSQEVPPSGSGATGAGTVTINPDGSVTYLVTTSGITGTAAHIHGAPVGANGAIIVGLSGGPSTWSGTTAPLSTADLDAIQAQGTYINVHSGAFPSGEIRGQLIPSAVNYFTAPGCAPLTLSFDGASSSTGGTAVVNITGGAAGSLGLLLLSLGPDLDKLKKEPFLLDKGLLFPLSVLVGLDGSGNASFPFPLPAFGAGGSLYWQFFNLDAAAPNGQYNISNGSEQVLVVLP